MDSPDPAEVLRRILETAGWVERTAAEVRAEELGLSWRRARAEIERCVREGRITSRVAGDGTERIAWSGGPAVEEP